MLCVDGGGREGEGGMAVRNLDLFVFTSAPVLGSGYIYRMWSIANVDHSALWIIANDLSSLILRAKPILFP